MTEARHPDERVKELLRANERLAAEVRNLSLGFADRPRPAGMPTSRRLARQADERESLRAELDAERTEREQIEARLAATRADRDGLERQNREMAAEIARLSSGFRGLLRRARGRLLNRGGGGAGPAPRGR